MSKGYDTEFLAQQVDEFFDKYKDKGNTWLYNFSMDFGVFLILRNLLEIKPKARRKLRDNVISFLDELLAENEAFDDVSELE